jgi:hypothetical protein
MWSRAPTHPPSYREVETAIDVPNVEVEKILRNSDFVNFQGARFFRKSKNRKKLHGCARCVSGETFGVAQSAWL